MKYALILGLLAVSIACGYVVPVTMATATPLPTGTKLPTVTADPLPTVSSTPITTVTALGDVWVRSCPDTGCAPVGWLNDGDTALLVGNVSTPQLDCKRWAIVRFGLAVGYVCSVLTKESK